MIHDMITVRLVCSSTKGVDMLIQCSLAKRYTFHSERADFRSMKISINF